MALAPQASINAADTAWMMTSTALVLLMTLPGIALFYAGMVRRKNVLATMAAVVAIAATVSLTWFALGYSLAFTEGWPWLGGSGRFWFSGFEYLKEAGQLAVSHVAPNVPESVYAMFQLTFAIITTALVLGAFVERMRFSAILWFALLWSVLVYAPVAHWVWEPGGWLAQMGALDFAGGSVVHVNAGVAGLVCAYALGSRKGYGREAFEPYNLAFTMTGAGLLWVGWFGFNAGSAVSSGADAGMAMLATHLSAASATLVWMAIEWIKFGKPSLVGAVTGTIAGLATITPAAGVTGPMGAVALGAAASCVCYLAVWLVKRVMGVDDALDVLGVHGVGGALGTLLLPFVALIGAGGGHLNHPVPQQFITQAIGVVTVALFSIIATYAITKVTDLLVGLRVDREHETLGLDFASHGETGYHINR